ncbi:MAG TPA: cbb3-type cytochrome c oxidase N-terminal domain-containing protein [Bacteroidia bacterium]|nr:cbb3-type cytochrome c oxidase N-terminal domain-containing protein [Bacteroidia bacterium]
MKRTLSLFPFILYSCGTAIAQQSAVAETQGTVPRLVTDPMTYLMLLTIIALLGTVLVLGKVINLLTNKMAPPVKKSVAAASATGPKKISFWTRMSKRFINDAVPVEHEADVLLDHNYDGIRELDNNLPPWWKYGFYVTIIWAFIYMINYHVVGKGDVQEQEYLAQLKEADLQKIERLKLAANSVDENTATLMTSKSDLSEGSKIFNEKCSVCHGKGGEGTVGPNLTDDYWIHGGKITDLFKTIKYGVTAKGMIAWQGQLTPVQIQQVASYIKSLRGSNPPNPKAPQGDLFSETNKSTQDSSMQVKPDSSASASTATI